MTFTCHIFFIVPHTKFITAERHVTVDTPLFTAIFLKRLGAFNDRLCLFVPVPSGSLSLLKSDAYRYFKLKLTRKWIINLNIVCDWIVWWWRRYHVFPSSLLRFRVCAALQAEEEEPCSSDFCSFWEWVLLPQWIHGEHQPSYICQPTT